jgi:hypothetical protein
MALNSEDQSSSPALSFADNNTGAPKVDNMLPLLSSRNIAGPGVLDNPDDQSIGKRLWNGYTQGDTPIANAMQQAGAYLTSISDPKAGATMLAATKAYGRNQPKPSYGVIGQDAMGNPQYGWIDPVKMKVTPIGGDQTAGTAGQPLGDTSLNGDEYLKTLPSGLASNVQALVEGRMPVPSATSLKSRATQTLLQAAGQYEPGFDLTTWQGRVSGNKDFYGGGQSSKDIKSANQAISHMRSLVDSAEGMNNTSSPMLNTAKNAWNTNVMGEGAQTQFQLNAHAVSEELSKVFKGANMSDAEIRAWESGLSPNMSPSQQRASIGKLTELLNGSLEALEDKRKDSLGERAAAKKGPLLSKEAQESLDYIRKWSAEASQHTAAPMGLPTGVKSIQLIQ